MLTSGDAVNRFALWPENLNFMTSLGLNAYRVSLEWLRTEPEPGMFSMAKARFGLASVVRATFRRTPKPGGAVLAAIGRRNALLENKRW